MTAEQEARDLLERLGWDEAQGLSAGDLVELANLMADIHRYRAAAVVPGVREYWQTYYLEPTRHVCILCGGSGWIDTRESAVTSNWERVGAVVPCLCPEGAEARRLQQ